MRRRKGRVTTITVVLQIRPSLFEVKMKVDRVGVVRVERSAKGNRASRTPVRVKAADLSAKGLKLVTLTEDAVKVSRVESQRAEKGERSFAFFFRKSFRAGLESFEGGVFSFFQPKQNEKVEQNDPRVVGPLELEHQHKQVVLAGQQRVKVLQP